MANTILLKHSGTNSATPSFLEYGEVGINYNNGKLFYKNASGSIVGSRLIADILGTSDEVTVSEVSGTYTIGLPDVITVTGVNADYVQFDTAATPSTSIGALSWNNTEGSLVVPLKGGNVTVPIGQATVHRVVNRDSAGFTKGQVVKLYGSTGQRVGVALAQANNDPNSSKSFGVTAESIAKNQEGFVVSEGFIFNIDTHLLAEGEIVWLDPDTPGAMTTTKPTAPDHLVMIGLCVRQQQNTGILFVKVQNGYEVDELHDVKYTNLATGDLLTRTSNNLWENISRATLSADPLFQGPTGPTGPAGNIGPTGPTGPAGGGSSDSLSIALIAQVFG